MKKKLVMIGPVYPYKGGIAHYTGCMAQQLKAHYDVTVVSYRMQYPKLLFKQPQKDYDNNTFAVEDAQFLLHTANPLNWVRVARAIRRMHPDYVIFQWWHPYFAPCYTVLSKLLRHIPKLMICHNVFPHERFPMDRALSKMTLKNGAGFLTHSASDAEDLKQIVSEPIYATTVLPSYNQFKLRNLDRETARASLQAKPGEKLLLFFGFVREYKGLKHLIRAMPQITAYDSGIKLMVVGEFRNDKEDYLSLIEACGAADAIQIVDGYIPDSEIEPYFAAADLVVLPYESATQSGIVQIAYGFEKPVIATRVGGLPEVVLDGKTGYLTEPKNPAALAEAVIRYFKEEKQAEFSENVKQEAYKYSWERMCETIHGVLEEMEKHETKSDS